MVKALFIGGDYDMTTMMVNGELSCLHFYEKPSAMAIRDAHYMGEQPKILEYRVVCRTPMTGVLIYELYSNES